MTNVNYSIDETYLTGMTQELVRINSINPSLTPEGKGEVEIGAYVVEKLDDLGLKLLPDA